MNPIIFPLLAMCGTCAFFIYKLLYFKKMRHETQSQAKVLDVKPTSLFSNQQKITLEYSDTSGKKYTKTVKPFGWRAYKNGEMLDITYKRNKPEEIVVWNGQEEFFKKQFFWFAIFGVAFAAVVTIAPDKSHKTQEPARSSRVLN